MGTLFPRGPTPSGRLLWGKQLSNNLTWLEWTQTDRPRILKLFVSIESVEWKFLISSSLVDRTFRSFLAPDLLILDDLGLHRLTGQQSADLYQLIISRHRVSSFVITSNRAVEEWLSLFDDPILGNSALDRLANASYQIVIEGASYRERLSPHRKLLGTKEVFDPKTKT